MRIVDVITGLHFGGAEIQLLELSSRMSERGHEVLVVSVMPLSGLSEDLNAAASLLRHSVFRRGGSIRALYFDLRESFGELGRVSCIQ